MKSLPYDIYKKSVQVKSVQKVLTNRKGWGTTVSAAFRSAFLPSRERCSASKIAMKMFKLHKGVRGIWTVNV